MAYGLCSSLPSWLKEFESPTPLQINIIMKVVVCGDSFFAHDLDKPNTHWSELINYDVTNLAIAGASNHNIRLQIEYALHDLKPDLIIFNDTSSGRVDVRNSTLQGIYGHYHPDVVDRDLLDPSNLYKQFGQPYDYYDPRPFKSFPYIVLEWQMRNANRLDVYNEFYTLFEDEHIAKSKDYFVISSALTALKDIPFLVDFTYYNDSFTPNPINVVSTKKFPWCDDTSYHTTFEAQKSIAAIVEHAIDNLLKKLYTKN